MAQKTQTSPSSNATIRSQIMSVIQSDPMSFFAIVIVLVGFIIYEPMHAASTLSGVGVLALLGFGYMKYSGSSGNSGQSTGNNNNVTSSTATQKIKNIWEAGSKNNSSGGDKKTYTDKPFGSKYYYAHNNPGATGGYKDGLKMEDYRMNGPRLLSKGGTPVVETNDNSNPDDTNSNEQQQQEAATNQQQQQPAAPTSSVKITANDSNVLNITKYQWDDPGDYNGIATIRIDSLPTTTAGDYIDWKDIQVESIQADLMGEGLLVKIETDRGKYQLKIAKLYGDANAVKTIVKPKRLLVTITKKKIAALSGKKESSSNLDAWPQPYRKI